MGEDAEFKLHLFDYQMAATGDLIRNRARQLGKLLTGQDVRVHQIEKMLPLSKHPAGAFASPLNEL